MFKRYLISTLRVFVSGFLGTLLFVLQNSQTLTQDALVSAIVGATVAGFSLILKAGIEGGIAGVKKISKPVAQN